MNSAHNSGKSNCSSLSTEASATVFTPNLTIIDGQVITTSNQVAQHFGKRHADVMRAIRSLEVPTEFTQRNFALSEFIDPTGRKLPCCRITRDGFTLLAMGFTGAEAMQWKIAYLNAFNRMESKLLADVNSDRIRVSPTTLIENASRISGQLFTEALKSGALNGSSVDRFLVTADYKSGRCGMEAIKHDACVMSIGDMAKAIGEPGGLMPTDMELIALANACTARLARRMQTKQQAVPV